MRWILAAAILLLSGCGETLPPTQPAEIGGTCIMAQAVLQPTSDILANWNLIVPSTPTTHFDKVDEGVDASDGFTTAVIAVGVQGTNREERYHLSDVPSDVATITALDIRASASWNRDTPFDFNEIEVYVYNGTTQIGSGVILDLESQGDGAFHVYGWISYATGLTLTQAEGNDLRVSLISRMPEPPSDDDAVRISAVEVRITYTPTPAVAAGAVHKMHIGMGFGPGFRR